MTQIWLVRHAPPTERGVCYGQSNVPVTFEPVEAARLIYQRWQTQNASIRPELWTSPWARTQPVAEVLARLFETDCHVDARLSELAFGEWEGLTYTALEASDGTRFRHWLATFDSSAPPGGETVSDLRARVGAWLAERSASEDAVLAVTHAGVIRTARALRRQLPYSALAGDPIAHLKPERLI